MSILPFAFYAPHSVLGYALIIWSLVGPPAVWLARKTRPRTALAVVTIIVDGLILVPMWLYLADWELLRLGYGASSTVKISLTGYEATKMTSVVLQLLVLTIWAFTWLVAALKQPVPLTKSALKGAER